MKKNILITGCSSGLGLALTNYYLEKGFKVYGISRKKPEIRNANFTHISFDLSQISKIKEILSPIIQDISQFETVFLNAGILGKIKILEELSSDLVSKEDIDSMYNNFEIEEKPISESDRKKFMWLGIAKIIFGLIYTAFSYSYEHRTILGLIFIYW